MNYNNLKENSTHGNALFPFHVYTHTDKTGLYSVNSHWHQEVEILYVTEGEFELIVNMKSLTLTPGQCICINSGEIHSITSIGNKPSKHFAIVFDLSLLSSSLYDYCQIHYLDPLIQNKLKLPLIIDEQSIFGQKFITEMIEMIDCYQEKHIGYQLSIKASFYKLLSYMAKENQFLMNRDITSKSKDYKLQLMKKVFLFIEENYTQKIYIDQIASEINMNTQYFCRFFKSVTGKTPIDYINQHRIEAATKLLLTTDDKIMDICFSVGFDNFSYFIKTFKQYKTCTPSQYRKEN
ncbi:MAG: AraC family transcriptional regulator [Turicibacter sp.]